MKRFTLVSMVSLGGFVAVAAACGSFGRDDDAPVAPPDGGNGASSSGQTPDGGPDNVPFEGDGGSDAACGVDPFVDLFEHTTSLHAEGWNDAFESGNATIGPSIDPDAGSILDAKFVKSSADIQRAYFYRVHPQPTVKCQSWRYTLKFSARFTVKDGDQNVAGPRLSATYPELDAGSTKFDNSTGVGVAFAKSQVALNLQDDACKQMPDCGDRSSTGKVIASKLGDTWHDYEIDIDYLPDAKGPVYGKISVAVDPPGNPTKGTFDLPFPLARGTLESELGVTFATGASGGDLQIDNVSIAVVPAP